MVLSCYDPSAVRILLFQGWNNSEPCRSQYISNFIAQEAILSKAPPLGYTAACLGSIYNVFLMRHKIVLLWLFPGSALQVHVNDF